MYVCMYEGGSTEESGEEREKTKRDGSAKKSQIREERARGQTEGGCVDKAGPAGTGQPATGLTTKSSFWYTLRGGGNRGVKRWSYQEGTAAQDPGAPLAGSGGEKKEMGISGRTRKVPLLLLGYEGRERKKHLT